jgi:hypothetical protein
LSKDLIIGNTAPPILAMLDSGVAPVNEFSQHIPSRQDDQSLSQVEPAMNSTSAWVATAVARFKRIGTSS